MKEKEKIYSGSEFSKMSKIARVVININKEEKELFREVESFNNHMNNCDCDNRYKYDFTNTIDEEFHSFCLNCGGFIVDSIEVG